MLESPTASRLRAPDAEPHGPDGRHAAQIEALCAHAGVDWITALKSGAIATSGQRHGVFTWAVLDALRKGDANGNGLIELSELMSHVQSAVPKVAAQMGGQGRAATSELVWGKQAARFGSRGEDFAVAQRLQ